MTGADARRAQSRYHEAAHALVVSTFDAAGLELDAMWINPGDHAGGALRFLRPKVETPASLQAELVATVAGPIAAEIFFGNRDGEGDDCEGSDRRAARVLAQRLSEGSYSYFVALNNAEREAQHLVSRYETEIGQLARSLEYAGDRLHGQELDDAVARARQGRIWWRLAPPTPTVRRVVGPPTAAQLAAASWRSSGSEFIVTPTGYRTHRSKVGIR
jgi:hypothetical protein